MVEIFVDLDGVCADFCLGTARIFLPEDTAKYRIDNWPVGVDEISSMLGISKGQMWKAIDNCENFWYKLEPYSWTVEMCRFLHTVTPEVYVCTSPSQNPNCMVGKIQWLNKHKLFKHRNFFITPHKHKLAHSNSILIDDNDGKCDDFEGNGGRVVRFPQRWNGNHNATLRDGRLAIDNKLEYVKEMIETYL